MLWVLLRGEDAGLPEGLREGLGACGLAWEGLRACCGLWSVLGGSLEACSLRVEGNILVG